MNEGKMDESEEGEGVLQGDTRMILPNTPETSMCHALATHAGPNVSWVATPSCSPDLIYGWILKGPHSHRGFSLKVPIRRKDNI